MYEDEDYEQWEAWLDEVSRAAEAWNKKWPNACKSCAGRGGHGWYENHGIPGPGEYMEEPCSACTGADVPICARCMEGHLTEDGEGPCPKCGWNYDDSCPEP